MAGRKLLQVHYTIYMYMYVAMTADIWIRPSCLHVQVHVHISIAKVVRRPLLCAFHKINIIGYAVTTNPALLIIFENLIFSSGRNLAKFGNRCSI